MEVTVGARVVRLGLARARDGGGRNNGLMHHGALFVAAAGAARSWKRNGYIGTMSGRRPASSKGLSRREVT